MYTIMKCGFCKQYYGKLVPKDEITKAKCPHCGRKLIVVADSK
jgi:predicted RNA-binding Zn-ribbon protein involved in translation (DUF1610 family)